MFCSLYLVFLCFFFFKQKTAYEMRISDWSSDVCSSDLGGGAGAVAGCKARLSPDHACPGAGGRERPGRFRSAGRTGLAKPVREWQPASKPSDQPAYRALDQTAASDPADDGGAISCRCDRASPSAAGDGSGAGADEALHQIGRANV